MDLRRALLAAALLFAAQPAAAEGPVQARGVLAEVVEAWATRSATPRATGGAPTPWVVGDVDGDGRADVEVTDDEGSVFRRGTDGTVLWSYAVTPDCPGECPGDFVDGWLVPLVAPDGTQGHVAIRRYASVVAPDPTLARASRVTLSVDVRGVEDGAETWRVVRSGAVTVVGDTVVYDAVPYLRAVFDGRVAPGEDLLFGAVSARYDGEPYQRITWTEERAIVAGDSGEVVAAGRTEWETRNPDPSSARYYALGDVSGDGTGDYVVHDAVGYTAFRGVDGTQLWRRDGAWWVTALPGSGALVSYASRSLVELVGPDGESLWRRPGNDVRLVAGEVWVASSATDGRSHSATATAVRPDGSVAHQVTRTYRAAGRGEPSGGLYAVADYTGDGVAELYYTAGVTRPGPDWSWVPGESAWVDGRTGRDLDDLGFWYSYGASVDGRGEDLLDLDQRPDGVALSVVAGDSGRRLWSAHVRGEFDNYNNEAALFDADDVPDLFFRAYTPGEFTGYRVVLFSGRDGSVLWSTDLGIVREPATVAQPAVPARPAVARATARDAARLPATGPAPVWPAAVLLAAAVAVRRWRARAA